MTANPADDIGTLPNTYWDEYFDIEAVKLLPGQYFVSRTSRLLVTVAGSTTVVCLRDRFRRIGAMMNFMLADYGRDHEDPTSRAARSGTTVMDMLLAKLAEAGATDRCALEAKIFGGGKFGADLGDGERNARFLVNYLAASNIRIAAQSLHGEFARKVYFFPQSGQLLVRKIFKANNRTIIDREQQYRRWLDSSV